MQILLVVLFVFTIAACIPVPVAVSPQSAGYDDQYGSGYGDEYVDVPIAYGEPYYFAPPIVVTYPYDYYTYEMVGGFVDIVFWRGGHRYRNERWHDNGRLVSDADMRSGQRHQRIRASELNQQREKLRQNHNISHTDSYYGLKPRPKQQIQQRPQQMENRPIGEQRSPQRIEQSPQLEKQQPRQVEERPQRGTQPQQSGQLPQLEQQQRTQRAGQRPQLEQQQRPQQAGQRPQLEQQQRPQQAGQRPQWGQKQPQQVQQKPQLGQQSPQQGNLRQTPQQTRQRSQQEQQKLQQEREKKTKERLKKPEQEQESKQGAGGNDKRTPR